MTMAKLTDLHELIWKDGWAKRYPPDPEEDRQIELEKRRQREIDERVRKLVLERSKDKEEPSTPQDPA